MLLPAQRSYSKNSPHMTKNSNSLSGIQSLKKTHELSRFAWL